VVSLALLLRCRRNLVATSLNAINTFLYVRKAASFCWFTSQFEKKISRYLKQIGKITNCLGVTNNLFIAPFVASPLPVVKQMLTLAQLQHGEILYDLGCGDGRVVIMAAQEFGARSVGVEMREDLAKQALVKVSELSLDGQVKIINGDMFKVDLAQADVVTLYLTTSANDKVKPKLESELKLGTRVVSHDYEILGWRPVKIDNFCENPRLGYPSHTIYVYKR